MTTEEVLTGSMATAQKTETRDSDVLRWRFEELRRAGFETEDALVLAADAGIDLHQATALLHRGCPPETALRILL